MKNILLFSICLVAYSSNAQTKFKERVKIKGSADWYSERYVLADSTKSFELMQDDVVRRDHGLQVIVEEKKTKTYKIEGPADLTIKSEKKINGKTYYSESKEVITTEKVITYDEKKKVAVPFNLWKGAAGTSYKKHKANLFVKKDTIYVNFWLHPNYYKLSDRAQKDSVPYRPEETYFILLKDRQYVSFPFSNYEMSAITIPFKYHFAFRENDQYIQPLFKAGVNVSTFIGYRYGRVRYKNVKQSGISTSSWSFSHGVLFGLNAQTMDSTTTSLSGIPFTKERTLPTLSLGVGTTLNIRDFDLGFFIGLDAGLGTAATKWNYHSKPWIGFGLGYNIAFFGKKQ